MMNKIEIDLVDFFLFLIDEQNMLHDVVLLLALNKLTNGTEQILN